MKEYYIIGINYRVIINEYGNEVSLLETIEPKTYDYIERIKKYSSIHGYLKDVTNIEKYNEKINKIKEEYSLPDLIVLEHVKLIDEYILTREPVSGKFLLVSPMTVLALDNKINANKVIFNYSLEEMEAIKKYIYEYNLECKRKEKTKAKIIKLSDRL